jgi:hypothetical protein
MALYDHAAVVSERPLLFTSPMSTSLSNGVFVVVTPDGMTQHRVDEEVPGLRWLPPGHSPLSPAGDPTIQVCNRAPAMGAMDSAAILALRHRQSSYRLSP